MGKAVAKVADVMHCSRQNRVSGVVAVVARGVADNAVLIKARLAN
ncbi:MAG: hypothetical protein H6R19_1913 [Proteobacteria bacterium]|nr:hypothetical protein [Pseudomonadota bacterium]